mmetsp:Transcript_4009/g.8027  ORF Transcript_4009/g.8027 Transcript_4009/m.8027 type:complete len:260 (+) Transcript_4009:1171-1950(+)
MVHSRMMSFVRFVRKRGTVPLLAPNASPCAKIRRPLSVQFAGTRPTLRRIALESKQLSRKTRNWIPNISPSWRNWMAKSLKRSLPRVQWTTGHLLRRRSVSHPHHRLICHLLPQRQVTCLHRHQQICRPLRQIMLDPHRIIATTIDPLRTDTVILLVHLVTVNNSRHRMPMAINNNNIRGTDSSNNNSSPAVTDNRVRFGLARRQPVGIHRRTMDRMAVELEVLIGGTSRVMRRRVINVQNRTRCLIIWSMTMVKGLFM